MKMKKDYIVYAQNIHDESLYGPTLVFDREELGKYMGLFFAGIRDPLEWQLVVAYSPDED